MIEKIVKALSARNVQQGAKDSAVIGLATGFLTAIVSLGDMSLATTEAVNTVFPTAGALLLGYLNNADNNENVAGVVSANFFHRIAYYGTKGAFTLMQFYQI